MTGYADALATVGEVLSDDEIIGHIIGGLGQEYDPLMTALPIFTGEVSLSGFYAYLLSFEARQEQHAANNGDFSSLAKNVVRHGNGNRNSNGVHGGHGNRSSGNGGHYGSNGNRGNNGGRHNGGGGRNRRPPRCQICREEGHYATDCRDRYNDRSGNMATYGHRDNNWYLDTGATDHLTSDLDRLTVHERYGGKDQVQVANGAGLEISHIGHTKLAGSSDPIHLKNVLHVPEIHKHLLSVYRLVSDNQVFVEFHRFFFCVKDKITRRVLLHGRSRNGLYPTPYGRPSSSSSRRALSGVRSSSSQWHHRLGHPSNNVVESVVRSNKLPCSSSHDTFVCDACQCAKSHQLPYNNSSRVSSKPLELIYTDVWGPALASSGGFKFYVSFVDDFSRFTWIYLLKHKSDVGQVF